jgi:ATP-dependent exoDNAse (exonuclease V) alpha subunit
MTAAAIRKKRRQGSRAADLTEEHQAAYAAAVDFIEGDDREMVIAGAAGTGKTTVVGHVVKALVRQGLKVAITAPTNKAVGVLSQKTREAVGYCPNVWVGTIHALLGLKPELDERHGRQFLRQSGRPRTEEGMVIVVDECSMVDQSLLSTPASETHSGDPTSKRQPDPLTRYRDPRGLRRGSLPSD